MSELDAAIVDAFQVSNDGAGGTGVVDLQGSVAGPTPAEASPVRRPDAEPEPSFAHTDDYRSIQINGQIHTLTRNQAAIIKILHEAVQRGTPCVGKAQLLAAVESETGRVRDSFKGSPLWQTLVVTGQRRGTYRLSLSTQE